MSFLINLQVKLRFLKKKKNVLFKTIFSWALQRSLKLAFTRLLLAEIFHNARDLIIRFSTEFSLAVKANILSWVG